MTPRQRRMTLVLGIVAGVGIAGALALTAFRQNVTFYFDPSKIAAGEVKPGQHFRLGGMVTKGSVKREPGSLEVHFVVTDFAHDVPVSYTGVLPDLFREGTGVVAHGHMDGHGTFVADEVLAKHDEKYMPPEVAKSLKRRHGEAREGALDAPTTTPAGGAAPTTGAAPANSAQAAPTGQPSTGVTTPASATSATDAIQVPNSAPTTGSGAQAPTPHVAPPPNTQASATPPPSTGG